MEYAGSQPRIKLKYRRRQVRELKKRSQTPNLVSVDCSKKHPGTSQEGKEAKRGCCSEPVTAPVPGQPRMTSRRGSCASKLSLQRRRELGYLPSSPQQPLGSIALVRGVSN